MLSLQQKTDACEAVTVKVHRLTGDIAVDAASVSVELNEGLVDVLKQQWVEWKSANFLPTGSVSTRPATERRCCIREINVSLPRGVVLVGEQFRVSLPPNSSEFSFTMDGITLRHRVGAIQQHLVESAGVTFVVTREQWEVRTNTITVKDACSSGLGHFLKSIQEMSPVLKHFRRDASAPPSERRILFHSSQTQVYLTPVKKAESPHSFLVELRSPKMAVSFTNSTTGSSLNVKVGETTVSCGTETDGVFTCEFCFVKMATSASLKQSTVSRRKRFRSCPRRRLC
ncbi:hypothetical protein AGDE_14908 [Angomonas deanei]|nr:hypothetical protein AGDE_14908 [Angomonas deanei]|eukprot:EPY20010.1 hypothetical protein AGDE_14908 [Angomonas deanei]